MYKNQLQELAQRSCFSLPSYTCTREGPDHAPRFKASVNFNGEIFEIPTYCSTLRQAEHSAAEVALNALSSKGPSKSLTARVLDETGIYKNLLQETAHRAGLDLPVYTSVRSGPGHIPTFSCTVELAGMRFNGESAKTKKQAEKNAAIAAWFSLRKVPSLDSQRGEEKEREVVARVLSRFRPKEGRRREQNHSRRRAIRQDTTTTRDLLCEKLRMLYTNEASSSLQHNQTLPRRHWHSTTDLQQQQQQSKVKSLLEKSQEHGGLKQRNPDDAKAEMITKSFPLSINNPPSSSIERRNCYSKLLPFPEIFAGGFGLNHQKLAPAVHMRSVIPVCKAPPPKPPTQFNESNTSSCSAPSSLGIKGKRRSL
ncbi:hypothetical protein N665_0759s0018 [Sinapis alba]|nr:hypothetical protein N665_0759s0018 [Sinapis alba]